jgi:hypothetical protein
MLDMGTAILVLHLLWRLSMKFTQHTAALLASLCCLAALPAQAASSASSAVSDSLTTSVGSVSNSFGRSSDSSKGGDKTAAAGDYKIVAVTAAIPASSPDLDRTDTLRLTLQAVTKTDAQADDEFYLYVPRATLVQAQLAAGQLVTATPRPYGTEFSHSSSKQAFFLVLQDEWFRDLRTQAVTL